MLTCLCSENASDEAELFTVFRFDRRVGVMLILDWDLTVDIGINWCRRRQRGELLDSSELKKYMMTSHKSVT